MQELVVDCWSNTSRAQWLHNNEEVEMAILNGPERKSLRSTVMEFLKLY